MPCSICKQTGHNKKTCSNKEPAILDSSQNEVLVKQKPKTHYFCYILGQSSCIERGIGKTYNGYTVNLNHRLRQHNGEIKGGAYATRGIGPWEFIAAMTCDTWTNIRAMQVEWLCRYPTRKKPRPTSFAGAKGRITSLTEICKRMDDNIRLYIHPTYFKYAQGLQLPPQNVVLCSAMDSTFFCPN